MHNSCQWTDVLFLLLVSSTCLYKSQSRALSFFSRNTLIVRATISSFIYKHPPKVYARQYCAFNFFISPSLQHKMGVFEQLRPFVFLCGSASFLVSLHFATWSRSVDWYPSYNWPTQMPKRYQTTDDALVFCFCTSETCREPLEVALSYRTVSIATWTEQII